MLIKCIQNNINKIQNDENFSTVLKNSYRTEDGALYLTVGKNYIVYAISFGSEGYPWVYIYDDIVESGGLWHPRVYPLPLFKIQDNRLSKYWSFGFHETLFKNKVGKDLFSILAFDEWTTDRLFFEKLVDGDSEEVEVFQKYKGLIDKEGTSIKKESESVSE